MRDYAPIPSIVAMYNPLILTLSIYHHRSVTALHFSLSHAKKVLLFWCKGWFVIRVAFKRLSVNIYYTSAYFFIIHIINTYSDNHPKGVAIGGVIRLLGATLATWLLYHFIAVMPYQNDVQHQ